MAFMFILTLFCFFNFNPIIASQSNKNSNFDIYIVHVSIPENGVLDQSSDLESWYHSFLPDNAMASEGGQPRMVYMYRHVIKGFAARLTSEEVKEMEKREGFVSALPQKVLSLHTTHSPNFLGLHQNFGFWKDSNLGKGVIIGVLDSGIAPNHPSFNDDGMPPPPARWKGECEFNISACNNKLIGARSFNNGGVVEPPFDKNGHGTHTASTAAGNFVKDANLFGNANGTAVGIAPLAHLAMYKVCSPSCRNSDILAAIDTAIDDGVDIISISIGGSPDPFYEESIAVGAFGAIKKGVFVSCSAGNSGPFNKTLSNEAPWLLTVGASTINRVIRSTVKLGNGAEFDGESAFQPSNFPQKLLPLVYAGNNRRSSAAFCGLGSLIDTDVRGKVVLCETGGGVGRISKGQTVKNAGGAAMILLNQVHEAYSTTADAHVLPASHVSYAAALKIKAYVNSSTTHLATILFRGTVIGAGSAPMVSAFSSRGPSVTSPGILKPDIIGPGVSILAAWPFSLKNNTNTNSTFNIISGTSMSCPHLSGIAALIKSVHPDWSPAAIKSAIMTTADPTNLNNTSIVDEKLLPADIFATGSGHVNPAKASDPGLVYDIKPDDYIPYLCGLNYTNKQIGIIVQQVVNCTEESSIPEAELNYPSFSISLIGSSQQTYTRTVTNVGEANSSYDVEIVAPPGVDVSVKPLRLGFWNVNQKLTYQVTFIRSGGGVRTQFVQGYLKWVSTKYTVRSPISVRLGSRRINMGVLSQ